MTALEREKSGCKVGVELMVAQKTEGRVSRVSMSKLGTRANQTPIFTCSNKSRTQQISLVALILVLPTLIMICLNLCLY